MQSVTTTSSAAREVMFREHDVSPVFDPSPPTALTTQRGNSVSASALRTLHRGRWFRPFADHE